MNFYDYYSPDEALEGGAVFLAAKELITNGFQVIPLQKEGKNPSDEIRNVHKIIDKPLHLNSFDYYFMNREVDIGIVLDKNMEFIDIDSKHQPGVEKQYLKAVEFGWPELYEKLVIDTTPSGGVHILYRSEVVGGEAPIAFILDSVGEKKCLIERISSSNSRNKKYYIKVSPSIGYNYIQGNPLVIPTLTAEERNWLGHLAMSFNKVVVPEVKRSEAEREDSPWKVFNDQNDWSYILDELKERNWKEVRDMTDRVIVKRPGSDQNSSGSIFKDNNVLHLFTPSSEFESGKGYSPFGVYCLFYHDGNVANACRTLAAEGVGVNTYMEGKFWKREKDKILVKYTELLNWLHGMGYRKYHGSLVQVVQNIVSPVEPGTLKRVFLNEVEPDIVDRLYEKVTTVFSEEGGLMAMIEELEENFIRDTEFNTWLFFNNTVIQISTTDVVYHSYKSLAGYIWKTDIINRDFFKIEFTGSDAARFVDILGGPKSSQLKEILGYSINRYKDAVNPKAVVIIEDIDPNDEGESQGGSGKGLLFSFVKEFRKSVDLDGKNIRFQDQFIYQNVDVDTSIILFDDVTKGFPFTKLYSVITGPLQVNKKNKPQAIIPFDISPKIFITSNFSVGGMDVSTVRRKYEFAVVKYFNDAITPIDEFGREFFKGWDLREWARFDNFIVDCCQLYLKNDNKKSINNITANSIERYLINATHKDFIEYMDVQLESNFFDFSNSRFRNLRVEYKDGGVTTNGVNVEQYKEAMANAKRNADDYFSMSKQAFFDKINGIVVAEKKLTSNQVTTWFKIWAKARNVELDLSFRKKTETGGFYRVISWPFLLANRFMVDGKANHEPEVTNHEPDDETMNQDQEWKEIDGIEPF